MLTGAIFAGGASADEARVLPMIEATQTMSVTAIVTAIDHESRAVTLTNEDGKSFSFTIRAESLGLETVAVGDMRVAQYFQRSTVELLRGGDYPQSSQVAIVSRSGEGETPGFASVDYATLVAAVVAIDLESGTFKLRDDSGTIEEFTANNPSHLAAARVGDKVVVTVEEVQAISIRKMDGAP